MHEKSSTLPEAHNTAQEKKMLILIAGPYRSGTGDDSVKMAANLARLENVAWPIFAAGHLPVIGEWLALPIWRQAGGKSVGDVRYEQIFTPTAARLLPYCQAVLRLPGPSQGADEDVRQGSALGLTIYYDVKDIPGVSDSLHALS
jgi:hypothetical protein